MQTHYDSSRGASRLFGCHVLCSSWWVGARSKGNMFAGGTQEGVVVLNNCVRRESVRIGKGVVRRTYLVSPIVLLRAYNKIFVR